MSYSVYDQNGWLGDIANAEMLSDFLEKADHFPATKEFLIETEADANHVKMMIRELQHETDVVPYELRECLLKAQGPVILSDNAGDERIESLMNHKMIESLTHYADPW